MSLRLTTKRFPVIVVALLGITQRKIVAGHVREASEIDDVREPIAAGLEPLVASRGDRERVAGLDRARHGQEQRQPRIRRPLRMRLHLDRKAGIVSARPDDLAAAEDAGGERADPACREVEIADDARDRAAAVVGGCAEIDLAARIAELPGACALKDAARALVELRREPAKLG